MAHGDDSMFDIQAGNKQYFSGPCTGNVSLDNFTFASHVRASPLNIHEESFVETLPDMHLDPGYRWKWHGVHLRTNNCMVKMLTQRGGPGGYEGAGISPITGSGRARQLIFMVDEQTCWRFRKHKPLRERALLSIPLRKQEWWTQLALGCHPSDHCRWKLDIWKPLGKRPILWYRLPSSSNSCHHAKVCHGADSASPVEVPHTQALKVSNYNWKQCWIDFHEKSDVNLKETRRPKNRVKAAEENYCWLRNQLLDSWVHEDQAECTKEFTEQALSTPIEAVAGKFPVILENQTTI